MLGLHPNYEKIDYYILLDEFCFLKKGNYFMFRLAEEKDLDFISKWDQHIDRKELKTILSLKIVYIAENEDNFMGWLRYNLFWDSIPFMNMLYFLEDYRKKGIGREFVAYWEKEMQKLGYQRVMTSTVSKEYAQHFYYKLGYIGIGGFMLQGEPYEIILEKEL